MARTQRQPENVLVNNFFRQVGTSLADSEFNVVEGVAGDDSEPGHGLVLRRPQHKLHAATACIHPPPAGSAVPVSCDIYTSFLLINYKLHNGTKQDLGAVWFTPILCLPKFR